MSNLEIADAVADVLATNMMSELRLAGYNCQHMADAHPIGPDAMRGCLERAAAGCEKLAAINDLNHGSETTLVYEPNTGKYYQAVLVVEVIPPEKTWCVFDAGTRFEGNSTLVVAPDADAAMRMFALDFGHGVEFVGDGDLT